jgi:hypothetical protein
MRNAVSDQLVKEERKNIFFVGQWLHIRIINVDSENENDIINNLV